MRIPSLLRPTASASRTLWQLYALATAVAATAANFSAVDQPLLDLSSLGRVGLVGNFDAISLYQYNGQFESSGLNNGSQGLLTTLPNGLFASLQQQANSGINAMCNYELSDGTQKGLVVGGNFTRIGNVAANGIAMYDINNNEVTAIQGFQGTVNALACDKTTNRVYVGGSFSHDNSTNAIAYEDGKGWVALPFEGFSDPVESIALSNNASVIFGGNFDAVNNSTNTTSVKNAQTLNIGSANITAVGTTDLANFNDPSAITCSNSTDKQWLLNDGEQGSWTATFNFEFFPTKLRLTNANHEGRGTKIFRFTAVSLNAIMNLTYTDNSTSTKKYCDAWCNLAQSDDPQDFEFVNPGIGMGDFRIDIFDHYGSGGGLSGVEIFQDDIYAYAVPDLNEPTCVNSATRSNSTVDGTWQTRTISGSNYEYLDANLTTSDLSAAEIVFQPHLQTSGKYKVLVWTPGCQQDGSCNTRGEVNVTGTFTTDGNQSNATTFFQTNDNDKYDPVYYGQVDATSDTFRPSVTLRPTTNQAYDSVNIVAWKVQFVSIGANSTNSIDGSQGDTLNSTNSIKLNGIYEYYVNSDASTDSSDSVITSAGQKLNSDAQIHSVVVNEKITYVGGNFTAEDGSFENFFSIDDKGVVSPTEGGLSGSVNSMFFRNGTIWVGGAFEGTKSGSTQGLSFVGSYDTDSNKWAALGGGLDGTVNRVVLVSLNLTTGVTEGIAFSGDFQNVKADGKDAAVGANGFAVWIPSQTQWLARIDTEHISIQGVLSTSYVSGSTAVYGGAIDSNTNTASDLVYLNANGGADTITSSSLKMLNDTNNSTLSKRSTQVELLAQNFTGAYVGAFYNTNGYNLAILGGHFSAKGNTSTVNNLALLDSKNNDAVTGITDEIDADGTIFALETVDNLLYAGGSISSPKGLAGLIIWDIEGGKMAADQPPGLQGTNVSVRTITQRPHSNEVYVGGNFESAGSLNCPSLCVFDNNVKQWDIPGGTIGGTVYVTGWVDANTLIVGGDMILNNTETYIALYNAKTSSWTSIASDISAIPGPVTTISRDTQYATSVFIGGESKDGKPYLLKLQNNNITSIDTDFDDSSTIRNVQVLGLKSSRSNSGQTPLVNAKNVLLVTGSLYSPTFGNFSAATYDGATWTPFLLTSTANGGSGSIASFISENAPSFTIGGHKLAKGFVILISLAIALALVFLIVAAGVLASYIRRRREGYVPAPTAWQGAEKSSAMQDRLPPQDLFSNANRPGAAPAI